MPKSIIPPIPSDFAERTSSTSKSTDGVREGYDLPLIRAIKNATAAEVVASGGAGELEHFYEAVVKGGAQILLAASVFHYRILSIREVKTFLREKGLQVNL
jgi:cyclase